MTAYLFFVGIIVGSFLNVCICRLPKGQDVIHTDSHCMSCGYRLAWFDMIPIVSWLCLRGRCRKCGTKVSIQYPLIELLNGLLWAGLVWRYGLTSTGICFCIAVSALLVLSVIDWQTYEIPRECNVIILLSGLVRLLSHKAEWLQYIAGFFCVSSLLLLILILSRGRAMGGGDVKLMAAAGLLLGWKNTILAFAVGCILGSVIHPALMKLKGKDRMLAFGPYLSAGIWFSMMWGTELFNWYLGQFL